jgi:hypothetical protein
MARRGRMMRLPSGSARAYHARGEVTVMGPRMRLALLSVLVVVAACSGSGQTPTAQPNATPGPTAFSISVKSDSTGVSPKFNLAAGTYRIDYRSTAPKGGCGLSLLLEPKADGKIVESTLSMPDVSGQAGPFEGTDTWSSVPAGTYVLQADRTGLALCKAAWTATLTATDE